MSSAVTAAAAAIAAAGQLGNQMHCAADVTKTPAGLNIYLSGKSLKNNQVWTEDICHFDV